LDRSNYHFDWALLWQFRNPFLRLAPLLLGDPHRNRSYFQLDLVRPKGDSFIDILGPCNGRFVVIVDSHRVLAWRGDGGVGPQREVVVPRFAKFQHYPRENAAAQTIQANDGQQIPLIVANFKAPAV